MRLLLTLTALLLTAVLPGCTQIAEESAGADSLHSILDDHWAMSVEEKIYFRNAERIILKRPS